MMKIVNKRRFIYKNSQKNNVKNVIKKWQMYI